MSNYRIVEMIRPSGDSYLQVQQFNGTSWYDVGHSWVLGSGDREVLLQNCRDIITSLKSEENPKIIEDNL